MSCSNCFNGCADGPLSDQCVRYTGIPIPNLGIDTGDPLLVVENQIIKKIQDLMIGVGVIPVIDPNIICTLVHDNLPCCPPADLNDILTALIKSICALDTRLVSAQNQLDILNSDYIIGCLEDVEASSDTHDIVQATITKLCAVADELTALSANVIANYVKTEDLPAAIQAYINSLPITDKNYAKMLPDVPYAYFGSLSAFANDGTGSGVWEKVFLCNGDHGTPDLRGVVLVGATNMPGNFQMNGLVDPAVNNNPAYLPNNVIVGNNLGYITDLAQTPSHTHFATITIHDPGHVHTGVGSASDAGEPTGTLPLLAFAENSPTYTTNSSKTGLIGDEIPHNVNQNVTVVNSYVGELAGQVAGHSNFQPGKGMNYIMYKP